MRSETKFPLERTPLLEPLAHAWDSGWLDDFSEDHFLIRTINNDLGEFRGESNFITNNVWMQPIDSENFCETFLMNFSFKIGALVRIFGGKSIERFFRDQLSAGKANYNEDQFFRGLSEVSILSYWAGRCTSAIYEPKLNGKKNPEARFNSGKDYVADVEVKTPGFNNEPPHQTFVIPTVLLSSEGRKTFSQKCEEYNVKALMPRVDKLKDFLNSAASKFEPVDHKKHLNLLYINWTFSEYPVYSFLEAAGLLSNSCNGILSHKDIGLSLGLHKEVYDRITAVIVYTESLNGLVFSDFRYVWTGGEYGKHFRCYVLHNNGEMYKITGMNPDNPLDDIKILIGRIGFVPDKIQADLRDCVSENMLKG